MEREFSCFNSEVDVLGNPVLPTSTDVTVVEQRRERETSEGITTTRFEEEKEGIGSRVELSGSQSSSEYEFELPETQPTAFDPPNFGLRRRLKRKVSDKVILDGDDEDRIVPPKRFFPVPAQGDEKAEKESEYDLDTLRRYAEHCVHVDNDPESGLMKLTIEEFLCQTEVDENEFGSSHDLQSVFNDYSKSSYLNEEQKKRWKLRHNRFIEVMKRSEQREQEENVKDGVVTKK